MNPAHKIAAEAVRSALKECRTESFEMVLGVAEVAANLASSFDDDADFDPRAFAKASGFQYGLLDPESVAAATGWCVDCYSKQSVRGQEKCRKCLKKEV